MRHNSKTAVRKSFLNICIIESDIIDQFYIKIKIEQNGVPCTVSCFENSQDLFSIFDERAPIRMTLPDVVLLDSKLPLKEIREVLERLNGEVEKDGYCPNVYLMSSFNNPGYHGIGEHELVRGCLTKPISAQNIADIFLGASKIVL